MLRTMHVYKKEVQIVVCNNKDSQKSATVTSKKYCVQIVSAWIKVKNTTYKFITIYLKMKFD